MEGTVGLETAWKLAGPALSFWSPNHGTIGAQWGGLRASPRGPHKGSSCRQGEGRQQRPKWQPHPRVAQQPPVQKGQWVPGGNVEVWVSLGMWSA